MSNETNIVDGDAGVEPDIRPWQRVCLPEPLYATASQSIGAAFRRCSCSCRCCPRWPARFF